MLTLAAILQPEPVWAFSTHEALVQGERKISGVVKAAESGEPLAGAVVVVTGTSQYATTDLDGRFTLTVPSGKTTLEVSFFGYKTLSVTPSESMQISLEAEVREIDEAVVIAYGKQSRMSITGSISAINNKELLKSPSGSAANALAGAVTGISSVQVPASQAPKILASMCAAPVLSPRVPRRP